MNSGTIADSVNTAAVTATNTHVGGIAGNHLGGEITGCGNTGAVTGGSDYIGGVAGACLGASITESYNSGSVTGAEKSEANVENLTPLLPSRDLSEKRSERSECQFLLRPSCSSVAASCSEMIERVRAGLVH